MTRKSCAAMFALLVATQAVAQTAVPTGSTINDATPAIDPQRLALGRQIIDVVLPPNQRQQMMESIVGSMMRSVMSGIEQDTGLQTEIAANPAAKAVIDRYIDRQDQLVSDDIRQQMPQLIDAYAHAYARNFSVAELDEVKRFVSTPAGAKFLQRGPALIADPDVQNCMRALTARGMQREPAEMDKLKADLKAAGVSEAP